MLHPSFLYHQGKINFSHGQSSNIHIKHNFYSLCIIVLSPIKILMLRYVAYKNCEIFEHFKNWKFFRKKHAKSGYESSGNEIRYFLLPPFWYPQRENDFFRARWSRMSSNENFDSLCIRLLSPIRILMFGHVAHKNSDEFWHIKKTGKISL